MHHRARVLVAGVLALTPVPASAQPTVTFERALEDAASSPEVRSFERARQVRSRADGAISDVTGWTQIWLQPGWRALDERDQGYASQYYFTHAWTLADLAGAQRRAAATERESLDASARQAALRHRLTAASAWVALFTHERLLVELAQQLADAQASSATMERAATSGVRTRADVAEAQAFAAEIEISLLAAEASATEARHVLAEAMGVAPDPGLATAGEPPAPELPSLEALRQGYADVDALPEIEARRLSALAMHLHADEVAAQFAPQLQLGIQLQNEAPSGFSAFGIAALTFGLADLGARSRAAALGEAEREEASIDTERVAAHRELEHAVHEVEHSRQEAEAVTLRLVPSLEALVAARDAALRAGAGTVFELVIARRRLAEARARSILAAGARTAAEIHAWLLLQAIGGES